MTASSFKNIDLRLLHFLFMPFVTNTGDFWVLSVNGSLKSNRENKNYSHYFKVPSEI
jgi:hypothetical protein